MSERLRNFPISFFAPVLGFAGFSLALLKVSKEFSLGMMYAQLSAGVTWFLLGLVSLLYGAKMLLAWTDVKHEFQHPVRINFFPLIAKILLVMSVFYESSLIGLSKYLWWAGVVLTTWFTFVIIGEWVSREHFKVQHFSPAWFIPVVGCVIIPIAGVHHAPEELLWFYFTIGFVWMCILTTIIINRLIFHEPLPKKLMPTLFILFAAPSIAFIACTKLIGDCDNFSNMLYYFSFFLFLFMLTQWRLFYKIEFYLSWWAYSFPLAAFVLATLRFYHLNHIIYFKYLSAIVLVGLALLLVLLIIKTILAIWRKEICVPE